VLKRQRKKKKGRKEKEKKKKGWCSLPSVLSMPVYCSLFLVHLLVLRDDGWRQH